MLEERLGQLKEREEEEARKEDERQVDERGTEIDSKEAKRREATRDEENSLIRRLRSNTTKETGINTH